MKVIEIGQTVVLGPEGPVQGKIHRFDMMAGSVPYRFDMVGETAADAAMTLVVQLSLTRSLAALLFEDGTGKQSTRERWELLRDAQDENPSPSICEWDSSGSIRC